MLLSLLTILAFIPLASLLQHEKSFKFDNAASSVFALVLYNRSLLITSSNDVAQIDIETGILQRKFIAHTARLSSILVVNGSRMITSGSDDMIIVWDLVTGSVLKRIWLQSSRTSPSDFSLDGNNLFVSGTDSWVRIVNMVSAKVVQSFNVNAAANVIVAQDNYFYVGKEEVSSQLEKYFVTGSLILDYMGHTNSVFSLLLWEETLFSGSSDSKIICWDKANGQMIRTYLGSTDATFVLSIYDDYLYSAGQDRFIMKWNIESGSIVETFPKPHTGFIWCFAFEPGSLFSGSSDTTVIRWDLNTSSRVFTYTGRNIQLRSVVLWRNLVIAGGDNLALTIQDTTRNSIFPIEVASGHSKDGIVCMILLDDVLFSGGVDATIRSRNLIDFTDLNIYYGHYYTVTSLVSDLLYLYSGSVDTTVIRWNISSGLIDKEYIGHDAMIRTIKTRENLLYSGASNSKVFVWEKEKENTFTILYSSTDISSIFIYGDALLIGARGISSVSVITYEILAWQQEPHQCMEIVATVNRIYTAHSDGLIRGRDIGSLTIIEFFQGHTDTVVSISLDNANVLFSTSFDGSVKKWNMATRKVSFSYENRNGSVTALTASNGILFVGTREGIINSFIISTSYIIKSTNFHKSSVTSLAQSDDSIFSSGMDGRIIGLDKVDYSSSIELYNAESFPITTMTLNAMNLILVKDENEIIILPRLNFSFDARSIESNLPLVSIVANGDMMFAGSRTGSIIAWDVKFLETSFTLEEHNSQVNFLLITDSFLYSASNDKTIIKWSIERRLPTVSFKRLSASALGHLGPVNSLSLCKGTLFSASSDLTTRRWNTQTGRHDDVYFGALKSVTTVVCYNGSVFAGSEDFSVLMYVPILPVNADTKIALKTSRNNLRSVRTKIAIRSTSLSSETSQTALISGGIFGAVILAAAVMAYFFLLSKRKMRKTGKNSSTEQEFSEFTTDLDTVVNTVIGISKHAAYLVENSSIGTVKKIASGGGGEVYLARVMKSFSKEKTGVLVIQKKIFVKDRITEEAFYQEVGIMIMLSPFPNFCRIIGYTENPSSMILQYYHGGTLQSWIQGNKIGQAVIMKISKEISSALNVMHSHYLAHCDLKPQNVLIEVFDGIPTCYLTDFGITQVLSEKILASRAFKVINLRGLSVWYAAPEAFRWFRTKVYNGVDFKKFDVYSFACIVLELVTRKTPWS